MERTFKIISLYSLNSLLNNNSHHRNRIALCNKCLMQIPVTCSVHLQQQLMLILVTDRKVWKRMEAKLRVKINYWLFRPTKWGIINKWHIIKDLSTLYEEVKANNHHPNQMWFQYRRKTPSNNKRCQ
jgi:hypothetical protein